MFHAIKQFCYRVFEGKSSTIEPDELNHMEGYNLDETVYAYLGKQAYLQVAECFTTEFQRKLSEAKQLSEKEKNAFVHNLKSASGNVGALALSQHCEEYEKRVHQNEEVNIERLFDELKKVIATLKRLT
ncbi:Hpt domain-containing protein [Marinomonas sp. 2405UD66-6]|uniref:Hpt domain-containing protein n=1 Tax=Marinomonas sp. 2405UD66-6 TaxID=3391834 RepID=UPI0039C97CED